VTLRLTVSRATWRSQIAEIAASTPGLVPVVKGNGYGLGQDLLMSIAVELSDTVAVGSIHEVASVPTGTDVMVLTPVGAPPDRENVILTVGSHAHVDALDGWSGRVLVKLASSMRRYGETPGELAALLDHVDSAGLTLAGFSVHPPTETTEEARVDEILRWTERIREQIADGDATALVVTVSHLAPETFRALRSQHQDVAWRLRSGTALWHGDKRSLHLGADVLDVRTVRAGDRVGYRQIPVAHGGTVAMIGAGDINGVVPLLAGGGAPRSPFHFRRRRLDLLEIHMHTSMVLIPEDLEPPRFGDSVDVQRPLIGTFIDELVWR